MSEEALADQGIIQINGENFPSHFSIKAFKSVKLPRFSMVVGINGVGKTQWLEAVKLCPDAERAGSPPWITLNGNKLLFVHLFNVNNFKWEVDFVRPNAGRPEEAFVAIFDRINDSFKQEISAIVNSNIWGNSEENGLNGFQSKMDELSPAEIFAALLTRMTPEHEDRYGYGIPEHLRDDLTQNFYINLNKERVQEAIGLFRIGVSKFGLEFLEFTSAEAFAKVPMPLVFHSPLDISLQELVSDYFIRKDLDIRTQYYLKEDSSEGYQFLPFESEKPWEQVNEALKLVGLRYYWDVNYVLSTGKKQNFTMRLLSVDDQTEVDPSHLSSGEKILFALAVWAFAKANEFNSAPSQSIILLDEIDAFLHPEMISRYIKLIEEVLIERLGFAVIASTHNLTTVALKGDSGIYQLSKSAGVHKLAPISRQNAIRSLSIGVPTLAIDPSGQRTVFTESKYDKEWYATLYRLLDPKLAGPRSLTFIGCGVSGKDGGEEDSGKAAVKKYARDFCVRDGNTIFGLTDWDTEETEVPGQGHFVLAYGERYSLENLLLDPLALIVGMAARSDLRGSLKQLYDQPDQDLFTLPEAKKQQLIDEFFAKIKLVDASDRSAKLRYEDGCWLRAPRSYVEMRGHDLHDKIWDAFPKLRNISRHQGDRGSSRKLYDWLIADVYARNKWVIPAQVRETFQRLLDHDAV